VTESSAAPDGQGTSPTVNVYEFVQVAAALVRRGDHIVLVRERRGDTTFWSVPGGGVEPGELVPEALVREVEEETGLRLRTPGRLAFVVNTTKAEFPSALALFFECTEWDGDIGPADPDAEVTQAILASREEALRLLAGSQASRPEIEPPVAYLNGATTPVIWTYRDDQPADTT
jgi:8-oxo-dGTP diphosphatase